jgi:hypothetical protein
MMFGNAASNVTNMYCKGQYKCLAQNDDLCSTNFLPSESALLQKSLAHDTKQAVLTNPYNLLSNDTMLKTWNILVCLHEVQSGRKYMHL